MNTLKIEIYGIICITKEYETFRDAHQAAIHFTEILAQNWTRHNSCEGVIRHMNIYSDLYNEGAIMLNVT